MEDKYLNTDRDSIEYYEKNADAFVASTINADVTTLYKQFEGYLQDGCRILDLGCGSGRDSRYFSNKGYCVVAADPSPAMCQKTQEIADVPVYTLKAEDILFDNEFDAVWACASLLHVSRENQLSSMRAISKALCEGGIVYCSWKYGNSDREDSGRYFTDMDESALIEIIEQLPELKLLKCWVTTDVRPERQTQKWLNVLLRKVRVYHLINANGKVFESKTPGTIGGHRRLKIYGRLDCPSALRYIAKGQYVKYRVFFADEETAIAAGYRPCARCMPEAYKKWKAKNREGGEA